METVDRRRMCPHCRAFISSDDKVCPYCNEKVGARAAEEAVLPIESAIPDQSTITLLLLLINAAFFVASIMISFNQGNNGAIMSLDNRTLILLGAKWSPEILFGGQWWRLITAGFLHGGIMHIAMNGMSLYHVGQHFEDFLGSMRLWIVYILGSIGGFALSLFVSPYSTSVGASAGLAAMVGALLASSAEPGSPTAPGRRIYTYWTFGILVVGFLGNLSGMMRIDNAAHIGGWIAGYLLIKIAGFPASQRSTKELFWKGVSIVFVALTLLAFWKMYLFFSALSQTPAYKLRG
jgi:rhomboid protease GluP